MIADRIRAALTAPLAARGLVVEDLSVQAAGRRRVVRVAVGADLADLTDHDTTSRIAPLSLDEIADATRVVSDTLDAAGTMGETAYVLEVSSPGVDRPLQHWRHWRRNVGRLVVATRPDGSSVRGRILAVAADTVELTVEGGAGLTLPLAELTRARVEVEFGRVDELDELDECDELHDRDDASEEDD
ncbi:MAG: ribosome maturation factor RimP [Actinomycetales bacterium]|nr:ribosome maturation factor RimP [Actinomycetales bacterium]